MVQVRIIAEVYPEEVCSLVEVCQVDGPSGHFQVPATSQMPFGTWGVSGPQLRECFVQCNLLETGLNLTWSHLRQVRVVRVAREFSYVVAQPLLETMTF